MSATAAPGQGLGPAGAGAAGKPPGITKQLSLREQGEGFLGRLKRFKNKVCPTVTYVLYFLCSIDFVMVIIGSINIHKCPVKPFIPKFLIILGVIGLVAKLLTNLKDKCEPYKTWITGIESFLHTASNVVFIVGLIFTYQVYEPSYVEYSIYYCNKTCYLFAFIYVTIILVMIILLILFFCCLCCCALCGVYTGDDEPDEPATTQQV